MKRLRKSKLRFRNWIIQKIRYYVIQKVQICTVIMRICSFLIYVNFSLCLQFAATILTKH